MARAAHHSGSFARRALKVREAAYQDPGTRCWRCGRTLEEERKLRGPKVVWHAGHTVDADSSKPLLAEHSSCNSSDGARMRNRRDSLNPSRKWF